MAKLRYFAFKIGETFFWDMTAWPEERRPVRIYGIYIGSPDLGVHLCELTPSIELTSVQSVPEWDEEVYDEARESIYDDIAENDERTEPVIYMHRSDLLRQMPGLREFLESYPDGVGPQHPAAVADYSRPWTYLGSIDADLPDDERYAAEQEFVETCQQSEMV